MTTAYFSATVEPYLEYTGAAPLPPVIMLKGGTTKGAIYALSCSIDGAPSSYAPVLMYVQRYTDDGSGASNAAILAKLDSTSAAATAAVNTTWATAPTQDFTLVNPGGVIDQYYIPPQGGLFAIQFPTGQEIVLNTNERIGIYFNPDSSWTVGLQATVGLKWHEG